MSAVGAQANEMGLAPRRFEMLDENRDGVVDREEWMLSARDSLDHKGKENKDFRKAVYDFIEKLWDVCDVDGDGVLTEAEVEFAEFLSGSEAAAADPDGWQAFGAGKAHALLEAYDSDSDSVVDEAEFKRLWQKSLARWGWDPRTFGDPGVRAWVGDFFRKADITGDGVLNARELQYVSYLIGSAVVAEATSAMFDDLDTNLDGKIDEHEFVICIEMDKSNTNSESRVRNGFEWADLNGDGSLDRFEAEQLTARMLGDYCTV